MQGWETVRGQSPTRLPKEVYRALFSHLIKLEEQLSLNFRETTNNFVLNEPQGRLQAGPACQGHRQRKGQARLTLKAMAPCILWFLPSYKDVLSACCGEGACPLSMLAGQPHQTRGACEVVWTRPWACRVGYPLWRAGGQWSGALRPGGPQFRWASGHAFSRGIGR